MKLKLTDHTKLPLRFGDVLEVVSIAPDDEVVAMLVHRREEPVSPPDLGISVSDGLGVTERLG